MTLSYAPFAPPPAPRWRIAGVLASIAHTQRARSGAQAGSGFTIMQPLEIKDDPEAGEWPANAITRPANAIEGLKTDD